MMDRAALRLACLLLLALPGCHLTDVRLWWPGPCRPGEGCEVDRAQVAYYTGPGADAYRHRLDVFMPRGGKDCPVVVLVHGGAWMVGDNRCCGLVSSVGEFLASQGFVAVVPNYRLSPGVRHPEHVKDVARAFAWAHDHASLYGGRPDRIFLLGHSSGGHLVSLLATDERYLREQGKRREQVRGVISLSGVYDLPPAELSITLGGDAPHAFSPAELFPFRNALGLRFPRLSGLTGPRLTVDVYGPVFGDDPRERKQASPLSHVGPGLPPFLIFYAEDELPTLAAMAEEFHGALRASGCEASLAVAPGRNHNSILFRAVSPDDPVAQVVLEFLRRRAS